MPLKNSLFYASAVEYALDRRPLIVGPQTPIAEVLNLMSKVRSSCPLIDEGIDNFDLEEMILPEIRASCVLVMEGTPAQICCPLKEMKASAILGIFTERDIVRLTAADVNLKAISVGDVMKQPVITLQNYENQGIFTALSLFRQHHIRHLPVIDKDGYLLGMLTPETVRNALQPANILTHLRSVKDVMSPTVIQGNRQDSVLTLAKLMAENSVSCVVISEPSIQESGGIKKEFMKPVGIVTERDIVQFQALDLSLLSLNAEEVMSSPLFCLNLTDSLWFAHQQMQERHVRRLVVIDDHNNMLGLVSQTSLLQALDPNEMYGLIEGLQQAVDARTKALKRTNEKLATEILERKKAEAALQKAHDSLQKIVDARTAQLQAANDMLIEDITERKKVEIALRSSEAELRKKAEELSLTLKELQQAQSHLVQSEKMSSLGQLVAGIAHEINNPVNFIYGNLSYAGQYIQDLLELLEVYRETYPEPVLAIQEKQEDIDLEFLIVDLPKLLNSIQVGAERIRQIVISLRNFSRLDEAEKKQVNIHEGIDNTLLILDHKIKRKGDKPAIKILKSYGDLPLVECYAGPLNQVFMNLLGNAIDALETDAYFQEQGKEEKIIEIETKVTEDEWVRVKISDNGLGMPLHVQQHLFEPFFTTKPVGKGTGLGLSISYQIIVEKHGGRIECNSTAGEGTEFFIEIPIKQ